MTRVCVSSYKESSEAEEEEGDEVMELDGTTQQPVEDNREGIDKVQYRTKHHSFWRNPIYKHCVIMNCFHYNNN